jgi:hypothetical protein
VLAENGGIGAEHLAPADLKTGILEPLENLAGSVSCNTIGLEKNQRRFHECRTLSEADNSKSRFFAHHFTGTISLTLKNL